MGCQRAEATCKLGAEHLGEVINKAHRGRGTNRSARLVDQFDLRARFGRSGDFDPPGVTHSVKTVQLIKQVRRMRKCIYIIDGPVGGRGGQKVSICGPRGALGVCTTPTITHVVIIMANISSLAT